MTKKCNWQDDLKISVGFMRIDAENLNNVGKWGVEPPKPVKPSVKYEEVGSLGKGFIKICLPSSRWDRPYDLYGIKNKKGEVIVKPIYEDIEPLSEGRLLVKLNNKYGFLNKKGETVIKPKYEAAWSFSEGIAMVRLNGKVGFIDKTDEVVINLKYDSIEYIGEGLAKAKHNHHYGLINKSGRVVADFIYRDIGYSSEGLIKVKTDDENYGFINTEGKIIIEPEYWSLGDFSDGVAKAQKVYKGRIGFIDKNGKEVANTINPEPEPTNSDLTFRATFELYDYDQYVLTDEIIHATLPVQTEDMLFLSPITMRIRNDTEDAFKIGLGLHKNFATRDIKILELTQFNEGSRKDETWRIYVKDKTNQGIRDIAFHDSYIEFKFYFEVAEKIRSSI
jgi:hypothetical protein